MVRNYIIKLLQKEGYATYGAENGATGLEAARQTAPHLIICDIMMPGIDGFNVLEDLKNNPITAAIPFIFLTGLEDRAHMRRGMEYGADDYLTKPFTREELVNAIRAIELKQTTVHRKFQSAIDEMRKNLTVSIPHEMLTPLTGILGAANILLDEQWGLSQKEIKEMARIIQHSANRLQRLIQNYVIYTQLDMAERNPVYSRNFLQARQILMHGSCAYLKAIIESTCAEAALHFSRQNDVCMELEEAPVMMLDDDIRKIVYEITSNACKFSRKGEKVTLRGSNAEKGYSLSIMDNGLGMSPEQVENLGAFVQHDRKTQEQQGSGLGLMVARRLIEVYGGSFEIQSVPGKGTTVTITFPLPREACEPS